jgi:hypothetical protein
MEAGQLVDAGGNPTKFEISGDGPFWLDGPAPETRADAVVRCTCGARFSI